MMKSKRGTALFDLLTVGKRSGGDARREPRTPAPGGENVGSPLRTETDFPQAPDAFSAGTGRDVPLWELDGNRLRVSLTSVTAAAAVFVLLLLLGASFEVGRRQGHSGGLALGYETGRMSVAVEAESEIETARRQAPATHLVESLLEAPTRATSDGRNDAPDNDPAETTVSTVWVTGLTYVVAQEFAPSNAENARHAQAFLADNGIDTETVERPNGWIQLITVQGYDRNDSAQRALADRLLDRLHAVGAKYYAAGGGYKLEGYFKTHK